MGYTYFHPHTHHRIVSSAVYVHIARSKSRVLSKLGHTYFHPHTHHRIVSSAMYVQIARSKSRMLSPKTTTSKCRKQKSKQAEYAPLNPHTTGVVSELAALSASWPKTTSSFWWRAHRTARRSSNEFAEAQALSRARVSRSGRVLSERNNVSVKDHAAGHRTYIEPDASPRC